jgi:hypothetical protein
MNRNQSWKIIQIIQAQSGWTAVHCQQSRNHKITIFKRPIICWAVVEPLGDTAIARTEVRGIEQRSSHLAVVEDFVNTETHDGYGTDQNHYFLGYNDPDAHKESDYWIKQANERLRVEKEKPQPTVVP